MTRFLVVRPRDRPSDVDGKIKVYNGHKATLVYSGQMRDKHVVLHFLGEKGFPLINDQSRPFQDVENGSKVFARKSYLEYSVGSRTRFTNAIAELNDLVGSTLKVMSIYPADNVKLRLEIA